MAPQPKQPSPQSSSLPTSSALKPRSSSRPPHAFKNRMALGAYIDAPESFPPSVVIYHNADFVVIHDRFPKATVHILLLPRSPQHRLLHPFEALQDVEFLGKVRAETERLKVLAAGELQRRLGRFSRADARREAVLNGEEEEADLVDVGDEAGEAHHHHHESKQQSNQDPEDADEDIKGKQKSRDDESGQEPQLPRGRNWLAEIRCGVHAVPSMGHMHVHVFSRDMHSPCMKHRKHYNSFNTPFLVDIADFPLAREDVGRGRGDAREQGFMKRDLVCWRCGRNFGNRFKELKGHLEDEFEQWKRE